MLTIKNKSDVAEIYIYGEIVDDAEGGRISYWQEGETAGYVFPEKLRRELDAIGQDTPLEVHINSCGGSIFAGVAMANFIANHKGRTTAIIDGIAASIASQIFFSAKNSAIPENGYLMLHRPFAETVGNAEELRKAAETLDTLQAGLELTYLKKAVDGVTADEIHAMVNAETWLTGKEAAEKFVIQLLNPVKTLNAVGNVEKLKSRGIAIPAALNFLDEHKTTPRLDETKSKIETTLARVEGVII